MKPRTRELRQIWNKAIRRAARYLEEEVSLPDARSEECLPAIAEAMRQELIIKEANAGT